MSCIVSCCVTFRSSVIKIVISLSIHKVLTNRLLKSIFASSIMTLRSLCLCFLPYNVRHVSFLQRFARITASIMLVSVHDIKQTLLLDILQVLWIRLLERPLSRDAYSFIHLGKSISLGVVFLLALEGLLCIDLVSPTFVYTRRTHLKDAVSIDNLALLVHVLVERRETDWAIRHGFHKNKITE